jgi:Outer membrane protein beta-barrel domain
MPANEFEKNVQKVMGEFKLHPSGEVWQKIEERIQEKKKKRRVLFFILFSCIGLSLAGYGIYHFLNKQNSGVERTSQLEKKTQETRNKVQGTKDNEQATSDKDQDISNKQPLDKIIHGLSQQKKLETIDQIKDDKQKKAANNQYETTTNFATDDLIKKKNQEKETGVDDIKSNINQEGVSQKETPPLKDSIAQKIVEKPEEKNISNATTDTSLVKNEEKKMSKETALVKSAKKQDQRVNKLKWGVNFSAGSSTITQERFSFKNTAYRASDNLSYSGSPSTGGSSFRYAPSDNKAAFAFKAGVNAKKNISSRSSLELGLGYSYMADRIKIGNSQLMNQSSNAYYNAIPQKIYTDRFHFIELPVIYDWRISKNPNRFLSLNVGTSAAYLQSSKALVYDSTLTGTYSYKTSAFTKAHVNFMSGISYHFITSKNFEWSIGPQFSFDVSRLIKSDVDRRKYILYGGIDSRLFFEKKKKK